MKTAGDMIRDVICAVSCGVSLGLLTGDWTVGCSAFALATFLLTWGD